MYVLYVLLLFCFLLSPPHTNAYRATSEVRLGVFTEQALKRLERDNPRLLLLVQKILLKQFAIELGNLSAL